MSHKLRPHHKNVKREKSDKLGETVAELMISALVVSTNVCVVCFQKSYCCIYTEYCDNDQDWIYYKNYCYYIGNEKISWHQSNKKCKEMGSELASLHEDGEINAIVSIFIGFII